MFCRNNRNMALYDNTVFAVARRLADAGMQVDNQIPFM